MLIVLLSGSGGRVEIPEAVEFVEEPNNTISFVDAAGRCLVRFQRQDVVTFTSAEGADKFLTDFERTPSDGKNPFSWKPPHD